MAVVGFTNLSNSAENQAYYEKEIAEAAQLAARTSLASYYATPTPARWITLTGEMATDGAEIQAGEITRAFEGHSPNAFEAVDRKGRSTTTTAIAGNIDDPQRKAATDVTISQPKGYSALVRCAELAGEHQLAAELRQAKADVIRDVVRHAIEIGLIRTRRGQGGRQSEVPRDIMIGDVPHARSRAGDAQEHDHLLFFNGCIRQDGSTGTLDLSALVSHKFYLQALIGSALAERVQKLGFGVHETGRGQWEMAGAPAELLTAWSKRRAEVIAGLTGTAGELARRQDAAEKATVSGKAAEERDQDIPTLGRGKTQARREAKQASALKSRRGKDELPDEAGLERKDRGELTNLGLTPGGIVSTMRDAALTAPVPEGEVADVAIKAIFERTSIATMRQFRTAMAEAASCRGLSVSDVEAEVQRAIKSGAARVIGSTDRGEPVLSTDAAIERECSMLVAARAGVGKGRLKAEAVDRAMVEIEAQERAAGKVAFAFADEQRQFVRHFARGDRVVVGEGLAGTGKTTAMQAVVRAAHASGFHTIGVAPTNSAAETLRQETHARENMSIQKLAVQLRTGQRTLKATDYVLIDEAGMAELADVAEVIKAADASGAHVALVGDERQFAPIGAGAPFVALASLLGTSRLAEIRRQRVDWQNDASRKMAAGDADAGLMAYAANNRWRFGRDRSDAMAELREAWTQDLDRKVGQGGDPATRIVIAQRHEDAHEINTQLRQVLVDRGKLGPDEITVRTLHRDGRDGDVRDLPIRAGDQLVVWRRVPAHNLNNGDRITVLGFDPIPGSTDGDVMLRWRTEKSGVETVAPLSSLTPPKAPDDPPSLPRVPFLQHAYCVTQYSSQGKTVDRSFVYGGLGLDLRSIYVALTRHRDDALIFWDRGGIAQSLRDEGQDATRANIVDHIRREARRMSDKFNVMDFVVDVDAWLATGDIKAERPMPSATAARMEAMEQQAAATIRSAMQQGPEAAHAVAAAAAAASNPSKAAAMERPRAKRPTPPGPRVPAEDRAAKAFGREVNRQQSAAVAQDRRRLSRLDGIIQSLKAGGGAGRMVAALRDAPRRLRDDLAEAAARAIPGAGEVLARWRQGWAVRQRTEHLDARRREVDRAGGELGGAAAQAGFGRTVPPEPDRAEWQDKWMRAARVGRYAPTAPTLDPAPAGRHAILARLPPLPASLTDRLDERSLAALARPSLGRTQAEAATVAAGAYAAALERARAAEERRVITGMTRWTGKAEDVVHRQLSEAMARPEALQHNDLRDAVQRLRALTEAKDTITAAITDGRLRVGAPVLALDPHSSPAAWRGEIRKAERVAADHAPPPGSAQDRAAFAGQTVTVQELAAMLRARRVALGMAPGVDAPAGSAAASLDGALGTLREAVAEGRLSARASMAAVLPSDWTQWRTAFRDAAYDTARLAGATRWQARQFGREADAAAYQQGRVASEIQQAIAARDTPAQEAERKAVQAAIEALRQTETKNERVSAPTVR